MSVTANVSPITHCHFQALYPNTSLLVVLRKDIKVVSCTLSTNVDPLKGHIFYFFIEMYFLPKSVLFNQISESEKKRFCLSNRSFLYNNLLQKCERYHNFRIDTTAQILIASVWFGLAWAWDKCQQFHNLDSFFFIFGVKFKFLWTRYIIPVLRHDHLENQKFHLSDRSGILAKQQLMLSGGGIF